VGVVVVVVSSGVLRLAHLTVPTMSLKKQSMKIDSWRARSEMAMTAAPPFLLVQNKSRTIGEGDRVVSCVRALL
jgi:hypothetical protein